MTECDEIILNNYCEYLIYIKIERYCEFKLNRYDLPNHTILNHTRKSHVIKFNNKVNEVMEIFKLKQRVLELEHTSSREAFNIINELFTKVLSKARATVEGPTRKLPYSQKKLEVSNNYLYWKLRVKQMQGKQINLERIM